MSAGQEYWIVATGCSKTAQSGQSEKDSFHEQMKSNQMLNPKAQRGNNQPHEVHGPWKFNVPDGERSLMFGSFDNLIRLTEDLSKADMNLDSIVHRLERQYLEIDPKASFKVKSQRVEKKFEEYIQNWQWDEAKYPRTRQISDNLTLLMSIVNKLDEEARNKLAQYNESKTQKSNLAKKETASLTTRDLVDMLTPDIVKMCPTGPRPDDDFVTTDHMCTICLIVPRGADQDFLKNYERYCESVVPMSAKKFDKLDDKDGNSLWRVVIFRNQAENFKKACREKRLVPRDFEYSEEAYRKLVQQREAIDDTVKRQHDRVRGLCQASWSDTMVAWIHIKAMRVFVESVLRFGMPPRFASFVLAPKCGTQPNMRKALADILGKNASKEESQSPYSHEKMAEAAAEDGEEYFPYVSFSFTPFTSHGK